MSQSKSLAALAAVLATGVTLGALIPHAMAGVDMQGTELNGISTNGLSLNGIPFDFGAVSVEDVQFPAVSSE